MEGAVPSRNLLAEVRLSEALYKGNREAGLTVLVQSCTPETTVTLR